MKWRTLAYLTSHMIECHPAKLHLFLHGWGTSDRENLLDKPDRTTCHSVMEADHVSYQSSQSPRAILCETSLFVMRGKFGEPFILAFELHTCGFPGDLLPT